MTDRRAWIVVVVTLVVATAMLPPGVAVMGAILGGLASLLSIGLVLAYRAHRFLNLAHASLGAVAGSFVMFVVADAGWSFWAAYPAGLIVGGLLGVGAGIVLGERLADASRTAVIAASLGLAFVLGAAHAGLGLQTGSALAFEVPLPFALDLFPVRLSGTHIFAATTVPIALAAVWSFLQHSDHGLRVRALAGNARHARRLGVDPHTSWRILWLVIGVLAAAAGIASQPLLGTTVDRGPLLGPLLLALAGASVAGMRDLPLTVGATISIGLAYQAILWRSPVAAFADVGLFAVIAAGFMLRASGAGLAERRDPPQHRLVRSPRPAPDRSRRWIAIVRVVVAIAVVVAALVVLPEMSPGDAQRIGSIGVFVLAGLAVYVIATFRGSLTLGVWALVGLGTVIAANVGTSPFVAVSTAMFGCALASVALSAATAKGGPLAYAAATLAAAVAVAALARFLPTITTPARRLASLHLDDTATVAVLVVVLCLLVAIALGVLRRSRLGRDALALREDPRLAAVHGVPTFVTRLSIDCIAGAIAGCAGVLYLWNQRVIHPDAFQAVRSLEIAAMTITGGIGSVLGPFLGGAVVKGSELFAGGPLHLLATGAGVLIVVVWLRGGLVSILEVVQERFLRRAPAPAAPPERTGQVARLSPAPAAETRKARQDPVVRQLASMVFVVAGVAGSAFPGVRPDMPPERAIWAFAAMLTVSALGAAVGHRRPRPVFGATACAAASVVSLAWRPSLLLVFPAAGYVLGAALGIAGQKIRLSLSHAARGWITTHALFGFLVAAAFVPASRPSLWVVAIAVTGFILSIGDRTRSVLSDAPIRMNDAALSMTDVVARRGGTTILNGTNLTVGAGEVVGIVGANGAGKTTLLRSIAGEMRAERGTIFVRHADATVFTPEERFRLGIFLSDGDDGSNGELTVRENLRLAALASHPRSQARAVVARVAHLHPALTKRLDDRAAVLSGGERRVLALAQAVIVQPSVLLVDELARGLSTEAVETYRALVRTLSAHGCAVVIADHDVAGLRSMADRVLRLDEGTLAPLAEPSFARLPSGASTR